jgi:hypothetical protein
LALARRESAFAILELEIVSRDVADREYPLLDELVLAPEVRDVQHRAGVDTCAVPGFGLLPALVKTTSQR